MIGVCEICGDTAPLEEVEDALLCDECAVDLDDMFEVTTRLTTCSKSLRQTIEEEKAQW